jgi:tripartite-type tricarboxylate transporter receptor subunit TctC
MTRIAVLSAALAAALGVSAPAPAYAQSFPSRPLRIIVPLPAGGAIDTVVRAMAPKLMDSLGQNVIVDNRPGAGGVIAMETAMNATPDGYTVVAIGATQLTYPLLYKTRYDLLRDFEAVSQITAQGYVATVHASLPVRTVDELVQHLKANPGKLHFASSGVGGTIHLTGELFQAVTGTRMTHVPYKGMALAYPDMLSGNVEIGFPTLVSASPHLRAQRLRALAVTTPERVRAYAELPTMVESGLKGMVVTNWYALIAPAATPRAAIERLNRDVAAAIRHPEVAQRLVADGSEAIGSTPEAFRAHVRAERDKWAHLIRDRGLRGQ